MEPYPVAPTTQAWLRQTDSLWIRFSQAFLIYRRLDQTKLKNKLFDTIDEQLFLAFLSGQLNGDSTIVHECHHSRIVWQTSTGCNQLQCFLDNSLESASISHIHFQAFTEVVVCSESICKQRCHLVLGSFREAANRS